MSELVVVVVVDELGRVVGVVVSVIEGVLPDVERDSQKGIVIGKRGAQLREVGTAARTQIEKLLGTRIYLDLRVKVPKNWQRDPNSLAGLGF